MTSQYLRVKEIADKYRFSVDAVYLWIREGKIPADCVIRIAGSVRVDEGEFGRRLRAGSLYHPRRRRPPVVGPALSAEDNFTTTRSGQRIDHRWTDESGDVEPSHPFGPEMVSSTR